MAAVRVAIARLPGAGDLPLPTYATKGSAGCDLHAAVEGERTLAPGERALIGTGFRIALPAGYEAQVRPRSGLALKHGLTLLNSPGTIDADYRGEIGVVLVNLGREPVRIERGDRIAQLVVQRLPQVVVSPVQDLPGSDRGAGGFGHTGER